MTRWPPRSTLTATLVPYTTLFRSLRQAVERLAGLAAGGRALAADELRHQLELLAEAMLQLVVLHGGAARLLADRRHAVLVAEHLVDAVGDRLAVEEVDQQAVHAVPDHPGDRRRGGGDPQALGGNLKRKRG